MRCFSRRSLSWRARWKIAWCSSKERSASRRKSRFTQGPPKDSACSKQLPQLSRQDARRRGARRGDEDGVVAGNAAQALRKPGEVNGPRHRLRRAGQGEERNDVTVVFGGQHHLAEVAKGLSLRRIAVGGQLVAGAAVRQRNPPGAKTGQIPGESCLGRGEAFGSQKPHQLLLCRHRPGAEEPAYRRAAPRGVAGGAVLWRMVSCRAHRFQLVIKVPTP